MVTEHELVVLKMSIEHSEQAVGLFVIALNHSGNLLWKIAAKNIQLSHHWTYAGHLEHQPLKCVVTFLVLLGEKHL